MFEIVPSQLQRDRETIAKLVSEMTGGAESPGKADRRSTGQRTVAQALELIPVDEQLRPTASAFRAITRDLSASGVSFLHVHPLSARHFVAQVVLPKHGAVQFHVERVHTQFLDPLYVTAAKFVTEPEKPKG